MSGITFNDIGNVDSVDAFTGGPVIGVAHICTKCLARYGEESVKELNTHNNGQCMSCNEESIVKEVKVKV